MITPNKSVVSRSVPPCCRKPSMPARSVSTWKLNARRPLTTAKRAPLASNQPAISTPRATRRRGRKTPICCSTLRTGSSNMSRSCMVCHSSGARGGEVGETRHRHRDPVGSVVHLVAQLVQRLVDFEQPRQLERGVERGIVGIQSAGQHHPPVGGQERLAHPLAPAAR